MVEDNELRRRSNSIIDVMGGSGGGAMLRLRVARLSNFYA
jgi:hypothetical protein